MIKEIINLYLNGKLREPDHEILSLKGNDEEVGSTVIKAMRKLVEGRHGKKILLSWD